MAALFKKALVSCIRQGEVYLRPNKVSSVYDCCTFYWLPIDKRMWSGELDFQFIENWAEDVELDFTGDDDRNNNSNIRKPTSRPITRPTSRPSTRPTIRPTSRPTTRPTSSSRLCGKRQAENWDSELLQCEMSSSWEAELFSDSYLKLFYVANNKFFKESWEGDLFTENYIRSFDDSCLSFKESWEGELLF